MHINILKKIDNLPPLPQTIIEVEEFRKSSNKNAEELISIIEKDALLISTLLKVANSAMFGFRSKIESPRRIVNLLGVNFTIFMTINGTINNILKTDLLPYGINSDDFMRASILSSSLADLWLSNVDNDFKEDIVLSAFLQEIGKFILSEVLFSEGLLENFNNKLKSGEKIYCVEKELLGVTTSEITAQIFNHWNLSNKLVNIIEFVDDMENCKNEFKYKSQILDVIKTACDIRFGLTPESINEAINKAISYNLDIDSLKKAISILENKLTKSLR
jgi:HD-like signal output (HDOD) protein